MRTSLTRAAAGAAVAAATVLALAGPAYATPAPAAARAHTTLSIVESRSVIKDGQTAVVHGRLAHDGTGEGAETVYLDHWVAKTLVLVRTGVTDASGSVAFTVEPGVTSRYELVFTGTATLAPSHSGVVTLKVIAPTPGHTTLSIVESRSVIHDGQTAVVHGRLAHDGTGEGAETVYLDHRVGTTLVDVRTGVTNAAGVVAFTVEPGVTSRYELVFKGTATLAPSHSGVVTLRVVPLVKDHTTLSIVESRSVIKDGQTAVVHGRLAHGSTGEGGETVYLEHWVGKTLVLVRAGVTNASGVVAFTVEPGVTSRYELVFSGTATLAASHSGVVTLKVVA
jgi:hypothetical protein